MDSRLKHLGNDKKKKEWLNLNELRLGVSLRLWLRFLSKILDSSSSARCKEQYNNYYYFAAEIEQQTNFNKSKL